MRRLTAALALVASCGVEPPRAETARYLDDPTYRRAELVASLTAVDNDYARLRLARYDSGDARDWSALPAWNPPTAPLAPSATALRALDLPAAYDLAALRALGAAAFSAYPAMLAPTAVEATLREAGAAARYGFWTTPDGAPGGVVGVALARGAAGLAYTCATCHTARGADGGLVVGLANGDLDLGALVADHDATLPLAQVARLRAWGPGRVDVTTADGREPVAVPDLRAVRDQRFLQRAGAVRRRSVVSLAIRVETLLITAHGEAVRPPREVALGLALYLDSLADSLPTPRVDGPGAAVFAARCAGCHAPPTYGGGLVAAGDVGTDPALARSSTRGTGSYRVPSLRGVGARGRLFHDGSAAGLGELRGHPRGVELTTTEAASLRGLLEGL
jgi:mono/diheme cytochrome c family protein